MGSHVSREELSKGGSTPSERPDDEAALGEFVSDPDPARLGDFLSGSLIDLDIDPVAEVRSVRRRERE